MRLSAGEHCAACYGQYTDRRTVDFDAAYDGPVIDGEVHKITIDDLIVCEDCLKQAALLLGWVPDAETAAREAARDVRIAGLEAELAQTQRAADIALKAVGEIEQAKWPNGRPGPGDALGAQEKARRAQQKSKTAMKRKYTPPTPAKA